MASVADLTGTITTEALQLKLSQTGLEHKLITNKELTNIVAGVKVTAEGDSLIAASVDTTGRNITISATKDLSDAVGLANSAVQSVKEGTTNGAILVDDKVVNVHGLGSAAYKDTSYFITDVDCHNAEPSPDGDPV